ncbi:hypothetical protein FHT15_002769 [Xanthomonas campestris]
MNIKSVLEIYKKGLGELDSMVRATEMDILKEGDSSLLVARNVNFFTKSFLISACAHMEMCVKDIVYCAACEIESRLSAAAVPSSIIEWRFGQKKKGEGGNGATKFVVGLTRKDVDDLVSGNVYKTKDALNLVGVDLSKKKNSWESWRDLIQTIVNRRNNIVHHNDDASDISLGDVSAYINSMLEYIDFIATECESQALKNS